MKTWPLRLPISNKLRLIAAMRAFFFGVNPGIDRQDALHILALGLGQAEDLFDIARDIFISLLIEIIVSDHHKNIV